MKSFKSHFNEAKDTHCSDKCCGANVKAADCDCPADCPHCNCNAVSEAFNPKHEDVNELTVDFINEHNITLEQLENMTEEELNELLGKAIGGVAKIVGGLAKGAGRVAKSAVVNKQGNIRGTMAAKADKLDKKADKAEMRKKNQERVKKAQERLTNAKNALRNKN